MPPPSHQHVHPNAEQLQHYYDTMSATRNRLVKPMVIITLVLFFAQQFITNFTPWLDGFAFGALTWAYLYAFLLFLLVIVVTTIYRRQMDRAEDSAPSLDAMTTGGQAGDGS